MNDRKLNGFPSLLGRGDACHHCGGEILMQGDFLKAHLGDDGNVYCSLSCEVEALEGRYLAERRATRRMS